MWEVSQERKFKHSLKYPKADRIPSMFSNCPDYYSKSVSVYKSKVEKLENINKDSYVKNLN